MTAATMALRALMFIQDADLAELIRDLFRPDDEVLALSPPSEELRRDGVQLLVADEDELPAGSALGELVRRWSAELPTILLNSRLVVPCREGHCLALPKPIPVPLFSTDRPPCFSPVNFLGTKQAITC